MEQRLPIYTNFWSVFCFIGVVFGVHTPAMKSWRRRLPVTISLMMVFKWNRAQVCTSKCGSWYIILVAVVVPWRTRRSWRRRHRYRTILWCINRWPLVWWWFTKETGYRFVPQSGILDISFLLPPWNLDELGDLWDDDIAIGSHCDA